ncbi:hypothetical protein BKA70DRAFT_1440066 [Coprinopsis sp. MPI-PUGE-AT-0042]|nr:hypothetical protein BKA70DRAFT_1440066 [Coprinopsis sp. MPI-PUGE-AT-0042]
MEQPSLNTVQSHDVSCILFQTQNSTYADAILRRMSQDNVLFLHSIRSTKTHGPTKEKAAYIQPVHPFSSPPPIPTHSVTTAMTLPPTTPNCSSENFTVEAHLHPRLGRKNPAFNFVKLGRCRLRMSQDPHSRLTFVNDPPPLAGFEANDVRDGFFDCPGGRESRRPPFLHLPGWLDRGQAGEAVIVPEGCRSAQSKQATAGTLRIFFLTFPSYSPLAWATIFVPPVPDEAGAGCGCYPFDPDCVVVQAMAEQVLSPHISYHIISPRPIVAGDTHFGINKPATPSTPSPTALSPSPPPLSPTPPGSSNSIASLDGEPGGGIQADTIAFSVQETTMGALASDALRLVLHGASVPKEKQKSSGLPPADERAAYELARLLSLLPSIPSAICFNDKALSSSAKGIETGRKRSNYTSYVTHTMPVVALARSPQRQARSAP